jgi:hypothetical protein
MNTKPEEIRLLQITLTTREFLLITTAAVGSIASFNGQRAIMNEFFGTGYVGPSVPECNATSAAAMSQWVAMKVTNAGWDAVNEKMKRCAEAVGIESERIGS